MVSDGAVIRDVRNYDVSISANVFKFTKKSARLNVDDWGDYVEVLGDTSKLNNSDLLEPEVKIVIRNVTKEVPIYINNTVYINNVSYINTTIEINRTIEHNNTIYLNTNCEEKEIENNTKDSNWLISLIFILGMLVGAMLLRMVDKFILNGD